MTRRLPNEVPVLDSTNENVFIQNGERVYPCRCGETHRGAYGLTDWRHHNCFHRSKLVDLATLIDADDLPPRAYVMCGDCGETWDVEVRT